MLIPEKVYKRIFNSQQLSSCLYIAIHISPMMGLSSPLLPSFSPFPGQPSWPQERQKNANRKHMLTWRLSLCVAHALPEYKTLFPRRNIYTLALSLFSGIHTASFNRGNSYRKPQIVLKLKNIAMKKKTIRLQHTVTSRDFLSGNKVRRMVGN